jgi:hypothetical protein
LGFYSNELPTQLGFLINAYECGSESIILNHNLLTLNLPLTDARFVRSARFTFLGEARRWNGSEATIIEDITGLLHQPRMIIDEDECEAVGGMLSSGTRSTRRNSAAVLLCQPQIPFDPGSNPGGSLVKERRQD